MTTPDRPASLVEALVSIQGQLPKLTKSKAANYGKYADLSQITDQVLPMLAAHGLAWTCCPTLLDGGQAVLEYALRHVGGETIGGRYPLPTSGTPQAIGSAITYGRRYSLCSVLGLVADEDDDGAAAEKSQKPAARRSRSGPKDSAPADDSGPRMISEPMSRRLHQLFNQSGITEREARLNYTSEVVNREVPSSKDLLFTEARLLIKTLEEALAETHDETPGGPA